MDPSKWAAYKKLRNEITADIRRAKAKHFKDLLADVKTTAEYWNLLSKENNPKLRKVIGPLKREDGSLAVDDKEKSNLVNNFFSNIGEKLAGSFQPQYLSDLATSTKIVPSVNTIALSPLAIERKLANLKTNKATGPDDISPKIFKEAGDALLTPLMFLNNMSLKDGYVFSQWNGNVLLRKLENDFGINGVLLDWLRSYLDNRKQYTVLNGIASDLNTVKSGIPQGSVLGPTLFSLYTSDLPEAITTATTYMYADDKTLFYRRSNF